jgi:hypothetical protein
MFDVVIPLVVGCCAVLVAYLLQKPSSNENAQTPPTNYFVIFCCGIILGFVGTYLFGSPPDETINNVLREIDILEPNF